MHHHKVITPNPYNNVSTLYYESRTLEFSNDIGIPYLITQKVEEHDITTPNLIIPKAQPAHHVD